MADEWEPVKTSILANLPEFPLYQVLGKFETLSLNSEKPLIDHQYGVKGSKDILKAHPTTIDSLKKNAKDSALSGYTHSCGLPEARKALAEYYSTNEYTVPFDNVILFQGGNMAQNHLMRALCNPGDNFIVPTPCSGLWEETAIGYDFVCKNYKLLPESDWEADLADLESQIDEKTRFFVVTNPADPTGSVYSAEHLKQIIAIAEKHKIPIVADEALEGAVFEGEEAINLGQISGDVPVLQMGGLGEQYFAFGWNTSWVILYDKINVMTQFLKGLQAIMQLMLHAPTMISNVIPDVLESPHNEYLTKEIMPRVQKNAYLVYEGLQSVEKYFRPIKPQGGFSMFVMVNFENFKDIKDEKELVEKLYTEESLQLLPSTVYHFKGAVRVVTCLSEDVYPEFIKRIESFCKVHAK